MKDKSVFITGGGGCLGREIIRRARDLGWNTKFTVFSTDTTKHTVVKRLFPEVRCVVGDIRDNVTLRNAMVGHDIVIHAAAVKHIPVSEVDSLDTIEINVNGSLNVVLNAIEVGIERVIGISTDKSCHPANAYGATKYLMEKMFQELSRVGYDTQFHLVRYGNVLESTASVIEVWKGQISRGEPIVITNEHMTRFWLSPAQAAKLVELSMGCKSGEILIPKAKSLSIGELFDYSIGETRTQMVHIPLRPGEKMHETLLSIEETEFATEYETGFILRPTTTERNDPGMVILPYDSHMAARLTRDELLDLLKNETVS